MNAVVETWLSHRSQRYHSNPHLARYGQTNADHAHGVVAIIALLHPKPSANLLIMAALHDAGEGGRFGVGDLPQPVKVRSPNVAAMHDHLEEMARVAITGINKPLTDEEEAWLKLGDMLEAILFAGFHTPQIMDRLGWPEFANTAIQLSLKIGGPELGKQVQQVVQTALSGGM